MEAVLENPIIGLKPTSPKPVQPKPRPSPNIVAEDEKKEFSESESELSVKVDTLAEWIKESKHCIVFTGAACSGFGSFTIKDSEIKVSTVNSYHSTNRTWVPMTSFKLLDISRKIKVNFIQMELKSYQEISMAVVRGVPKYDSIPKDIVKVSFGDDHWKWKMRPGLQNLKTLEDDDSNDITIVMTLVKPIKTRFMRINLPPYGNTAKTPAAFEVDVFSCGSESAPNNQESIKPLGIESSSLVPDSQLTAASSASPQNSAAMARLNLQSDGGGWCASVCNPSQYLQVAFGDEWKIVEVETQSKHWISGSINAVKRYSMSYSQDGLVWVPYKVNGGTKTLEDDDSNDITIVMTLVKPIKTRFMRINLPPYGNTAKTPAAFEVDVFSCGSESAPNNQESIKPLGIESSSLVPDSQLTAASSASPQNSAAMARLNLQSDGGGWCASVCNPSQYLQVAFGDEWKIVEVETQSKHWISGSINAVKRYSMSYSQDGLVWVPYKLFWGNDVANIATNHILQIPITAKFLRFEPKTCINNPCMRVELHGTKVKDLGKKGIPTNVLNVIAFDPRTGLLYGLSRDGKKYMRSQDSSGEKWRGIAQKDWAAVQDDILIRAEHIPFVPISQSEMSEVDPTVQMTSFNGDKWLVDQTGVYHKPNGGSTKMVLSFLPYNIDLSSNICHTGVCVHGKCTSIGDIDFRCDCNHGYIGTHCDTETKECASSPCKNGGSCIDEHLKYKCLCGHGFYGDQCQRIDGCASSPCKNGGTCKRNGDAYTCTCPPKYLGANCQVYDYCSSSPCFDNGTCTNQASSFQCTCLTGYSGLQCE
ncbi:Fibropellin-3, partial [Exaiptasia diaphana]